MLTTLEANRNLIFIYATIPLFDSLIAEHTPLRFRTGAYGVIQGIGFFLGGFLSLGSGLISDFVEARFFFLLLSFSLFLSGLLILKGE